MRPVDQVRLVLFHVPPPPPAQDANTDGFRDQTQGNGYHEQIRFCARLASLECLP